MKILIADDDHDLAQALVARCLAFGWEVVAAHDGFTTLALIRSVRPDVICLDVGMPGGNGLAVCEMLATDKQFSNIPIIVLTGKRDPDTIRRCHSLCVYYVEKCTDVWPRIEPLLVEFAAKEPTAHCD